MVPHSFHVYFPRSYHCWARAEGYESDFFIRARRWISIFRSKDTCIQTIEYHKCVNA